MPMEKHLSRSRVQGNYDSIKVFCIFFMMSLIYPGCFLQDLHAMIIFLSISLINNHLVTRKDERLNPCVMEAWIQRKQDSHSNGIKKSVKGLQPEKILNMNKIFFTICLFSQKKIPLLQKKKSFLCFFFLLCLFSQT